MDARPRPAAGSGPAPKSDAAARLGRFLALLGAKLLLLPASVALWFVTRSPWALALGLALFLALSVPLIAMLRRRPAPAPEGAGPAAPSDPSRTYDA